MATTGLSNGTGHDRSKDAQRTNASRIGDLSRLIEDDITRLKANLVEYHRGRDCDEQWESSWERLESAWDSVKSELAEGDSSTPPTEVPSSHDEPIATSPVVLNSPALTTVQVISSRTRQIARWVRDRSRSLQLRAAVSSVTNIAHKLASASATRLRDGSLRHALESAWATLRSRVADRKTSKPPTEDVSPPSDESSVAQDVGFTMPREVVEFLAARDIEVFSTQHATVTSPVEEPTATSPTDSFVMKPLPWVLGALSPVISSRTMQMHHGLHHSQCIDLANRLTRRHKDLAGKSPLEIVRWAREHARGSELLAAASDAWNHEFYWQSLAPWKKRPRGELRAALDRQFGDFANFAEKFALAGATHVGSGWLWLVANRRKQVRIMTTSDVDCPEARGHTCLLGIDLWEHAYYFDHQYRRREYLDAVIDRRLDWDFAEHRYRILVERATHAPCETGPRRAAPKRGRYHKHRRKQAASRG